VYAAAVFGNNGNFKSFGDTKFVPQIAPALFKQIVESFKDEKLTKIWGDISKSVYSEEDPIARVGFPDKQGQSSYYTSNCTEADSKLVDRFCQSKDLSPLNTRLEKDASGNFELKICSAQKDAQILKFLGTHEFEEKKITVSAEDFSVFMKDVIASLE
jgi:dipeptidyl-peptidase-3